jgi:hypothetical protein
VPHLVLNGSLSAQETAGGVRPAVRRWGQAVLKTERCWLREDGGGVLVEGVVVEHSRPLHPVALVEPHRAGTIVRLWRLAPTERTPAVQRWLALLATDLRDLGLGPLVSTNLQPELWSDLPLEGQGGLGSDS